MAAVLTYLSSVLVFAQDNPGRGDDPSGVAGVVILVAIVVVAALVAGGALLLVSRRARTRRETPTHDEQASAPLPSEEGRPWSSEP